MVRNYPWTSHEAERSVINKPDKEKAILKILKSPMTDEAMIISYERLRGVPWASESGLRTLRARMTRAGLIEDTGKVQVTRTGRKAIVWQAC